MARFQVAYWKHRSKTRLASPIFKDKGSALHHAAGLMKQCRVITVLRDSEGEDHPDNKSKFFLDTIVK